VVEVVVVALVVVVVVEVPEDEVSGGTVVVVVEELVVVPNGLVVVAAGLVVGEVGNDVSAAAGLAGPTISMAVTASGAMQVSDAAMRYPARDFGLLGGLAMGTNLERERARQTQPAGHT
jgi:hypothetical protein